MLKSGQTAQASQYRIPAHVQNRAGPQSFNAKSEHPTESFGSTACPYASCATLRGSGDARNVFIHVLECNRRMIWFIRTADGRCRGQTTSWLSWLDLPLRHVLSEKSKQLLVVVDSAKQSFLSH